MPDDRSSRLKRYMDYVKGAVAPGGEQQVRAGAGVLVGAGNATAFRAGKGAGEALAEAEASQRRPDEMRRGASAVADYAAQAKPRALPQPPPPAKPQRTTKPSTWMSSTQEHMLAEAERDSRRLPTNDRRKYMSAAEAHAGKYGRQGYDR